MKETRSTQTRSLGIAFEKAVAVFCVFGAFTLLSACGMVRNGKLNTSSSMVTDCILSADQGGTLSGRWMKTAVPIAFESGAWNSSEMAAIIRAADTWNNFFAKSMGYPAIDYGSASSPRTSTATKDTDISTFCGTSILDASDNFKSPIVLYKDGIWPSEYASDVIAYTTTCKNNSSSRTFKPFQNAYMELNYQYFFVNGNRVPDIQSIILHEFGHLMGINHSCEVSPTAEGIPTCGPDLDPTYLRASMYPTFSFPYNSGQMGEIRQSLNSNDMGRMNCVYKYL
jgi:hypothetical protein